MRKTKPRSFRDRVERLSLELGLLSEAVADCATRSATIDGLQKERDQVEADLRSARAGLSDQEFTAKQADVASRVVEIQERIEELYRPFPEATCNVRYFMKEVSETLLFCPSDQPKMDRIRADIEHTGLLRLAHGRGPISMKNTSTALEFLQLRLEEMLKLLPKPNAPRIEVISLPDVATWEQVEIRVLDESRIQVFIDGEAKPPLGFEAAGFADGRGKKNCKPNEQWAQLRLFASQNGEFQRPASNSKGLVKAEKTVQLLCRALKRLFNLKERPIELDPESKVWKTKFRVSSLDPAHR
jgi:uncharacterized protein YukE